MMKLVFFLFLAVSATFAQECDEGEITCPDGDCIPPAWICDGTADCSGGWDEEGPCPTKPPCDGYQCTNGECITGSWECDDYCDCEDCSDEHDDCPCNGFECDTGECISSGWICDDYVDCPGGEDEINCPTPGPCEGFQCVDGTCIIDSWLCDGYDDCDGGEDEIDCPCEGDEIKCPGGIGCIPEAFLCDTVADCPDGSDEENCAVKKNMTLVQRSKLIAKHKKLSLKKLSPRKQQILNKRAKLPSKMCKKHKRIFQ